MIYLATAAACLAVLALEWVRPIRWEQHDDGGEL